MSSTKKDANKGELPSIWLRPRRAARKALPPLSQERIVQEAISLLDEQGFEGLSMRRLAERLGAGAASLYWYVATKEDLLELVMDVILQDISREEAPSSDWRTELQRLAAGLRAIILRHPWSGQLLGAYPQLGPNALAFTEAVLRALDRAGLAGPLLDGALSAIFHYVIGCALTDAALQVSMQRSQIDEDDWHNAIKKLLEEEEQRTALMAYLSQRSHDDIEQRFLLGLKCVLDGLEQWSRGNAPSSERANA
ncbi:TetR family transcriptional regulator [Ktedonosporobacter rubrisoli]|uniref:TetR family transcriptional regulator n=1 Tax=Ktedonosporobacter rubrisoli TaxID=2509675 RepID=A0A4V0YZT5_KTERU|nr:TetR/AcrR family transcriptional regulator C-terminal domain-containing protein [Ktedonosporobacter rubrisoli]QBD80841.1 TetR family transcriptional regulator [Ktedonosporobacter rubrisoli]